MKPGRKKLRLQARVKAWEQMIRRVREGLRAAYRCPGSYRR